MSPPPFSSVPPPRQLASRLLLHFPIWAYVRPEHRWARRRTVTIRELAEQVREQVYPEAVLTFDASKPDGMPRKLLDVSRLHGMGWRHRTGLREGIASTYRWFVEHHDSIRTSAVTSA